VLLAGLLCLLFLFILFAAESFPVSLPIIHGRITRLPTVGKAISAFFFAINDSGEVHIGSLGWESNLFPFFGQAKGFANLSFTSH
jgi:hypothetical protein